MDAEFEIFFYLELASNYRKLEKFDDAIQIYQTLISQTEGAYKILPTVNQARCFLDTRQTKIAQQVCAEAVLMIENTLSKESLEPIADAVDCALRDMAEEFVDEVHDCDTALELGRARFILLKNTYDGMDLVIKLERIGLLMQNIAEELAMQTKKPKFKYQYKAMSVLMDEILETMQGVTGVGIEVKCTRIAWYLKYVGFCCDEIGDFQRSLLVYHQAITILKTVFGEEAKHYRVLGHCYNNMAFVLESTNHLIEAVNSLRRAIDVFDSAVDWTSDEEKSRCISKTSAALHEIKSRLVAIEE